MLKFKQSISGRFEVRLLDARTKAVLSEQKKKNLILDAGMDALFQEGPLRYLFQYCQAGTGNSPNSTIPDGTYNQAGTSVTRASGTGQFTAADVGNRILFENGSQAKIENQISATEVTVDTDTTITGETIKIFNTKRTALDNKVGNNSAIVTHSNMHTDGPAETVTGTMIYLFDSSLQNNTITEIGIYDGALWNRIVLDNPVAIGAGQLLEVTYILTIKFDTQTYTDQDLGIVGFPVTYQAASIVDQGGDQALVTNSTGYHHYQVGGNLIIEDAEQERIDISGVTSTASEFTVTTTEDHGLNPGDSIEIEGVTPTAYNSTWTVATTPSTSTFTVSSAANPGIGTGGDVRESDPATWWNGEHEILAIDTQTVTISVPSGIPPAAAATMKNSVLAKVKNLGGVCWMASNKQTGDYTGWEYDNSLDEFFHLDYAQNCWMHLGKVTPFPTTWPRTTSMPSPGSFRGDSTRIDTGYVAGSFEKNAQCQFQVNEGNGPFQTLFFTGATGARLMPNPMIVEFNEPQYKASTHTLTFNLKKTLARELAD